jgi:hypothetical protein
MKLALELHSSFGSLRHPRKLPSRQHTGDVYAKAGYIYKKDNSKDPQARSNYAGQSRNSRGISTAPVFLRESDSVAFGALILNSQNSYASSSLTVRETRRLGLPSRGARIWRRSARNTPPSAASSFGKNFSVSRVYWLRSFSESKIRISSLDPSTRSTRLTCFVRTA